MSHFYLGIDVGTSTSELTFLDEDCDPVHVATVPTLSLPMWREELSLFKGQQLHTAFEVGTHYAWLYKFLEEYC